MKIGNNAIIIGGGLGGLFTGAILAKEGYRVTVLEKNAICGGGLQCFRRYGELFETGMHLLGGLQEGGNVYRICRYLGIISQLEIKPTDSDAISSVTYQMDGKTYFIPKGRKAFEAYLCEEFPAEAAGVREYVREIYALSDEVQLFHLRKGGDSIARHSPEFYMSADELIAAFVQSPRLRDLLAFMNPMYGGVPGHTPAYIHALINVLYIEGTSQFVGGSQQMADALCRVIADGGGRVVCGDAVSKVDVADRMVRKVITEKGKEYSADIYISSIHPCSLLELVGESSFPKAYRTRLSELPNSYSCFSVYLKFKPASVPYVNYPRYFLEQDNAAWRLSDTANEAWPIGFMCLTPPSCPNPQWASHMTINCLMPFDDVRRWANTTVGRRGQDYNGWKERTMNKVLEKVERFMPGIMEHVEHSFASSPLTIRDYYGTKEGAIYGFQRDCCNLLKSQVSIATKIKNLLLAGQNINLHGICGVPLTSIEVAEAILGKGVVLDKINNDSKQVDE